MTYLWIEKNHLKNLERNYRESYRLTFERRQVIDGLKISFQTLNWRSSQGILELKKDDLKKKADIYLFYQEWMEEKSYLSKAGWSRGLSRDMENSVSQGWQTIDLLKVHI